MQPNEQHQPVEQTKETTENAASNARLRELEDEMAKVRQAQTPQVYEVLEDGEGKTVTKLPGGTIRTDLKSST